MVFPNDGHFGNECVYDSHYDGSNLYFDYDANLKGIQSNCYHTIEITAKQWVWSFDCGMLEAELCESGFTEADGRAVLISLYRQGMHISLHDLRRCNSRTLVCLFGVKEDVLPGQTTTVWILAEDVEDFLLLVPNTGRRSRLHDGGR